MGPEVLPNSEGENAALLEEGLDIILPVYNEGLIIKDTVQSIIANIRKYIKSYSVITVNDGSIDNTSKAINELKQSLPEIKIVSHRNNRGYGSAIRTGIKAADKNWVLIIDSDGQFNIDDFKIFWEHKQFYDFLIGYRLTRKDNIYRRFLGKSGSTIANLFLKERVRDVNCGFKLFKRKDLTGISLFSTGGAISFEILYKLFKKSKYKYTQLPVRHYGRKSGRQTGGKLKTIIKIILETMQIILKHPHCE